MNKTLIGLGVLVLVLCAAPLFAQGPFADVPTDHWAYMAVNELQQQGIVIGYPDGTFGGKRAMTRYEFAVAVARMMPIIEEKISAAAGKGVPGPKGDPGVAGPAGSPGPAGPTPDMSNYVTQDQLKQVQALVNEFKDELAAMGVDVDGLKKDVAALSAEVSALRKDFNRNRIFTTMNMFGTATQTTKGFPVDQDGRPSQPKGAAAGKLINSTGVFYDGEVTIQSMLTPSFTGTAVIDYGNYISSYLGGIVNDYAVSPATQDFLSRPTGTTQDAFKPYYFYGTAGLGNGALTVGRQPMQLTPYTLKMIDVDSYTTNDKTDSGDYPLDGAKLTWKFGNVGLTGLVAKTDQNPVLTQQIPFLGRTFGGLISHSTLSLARFGSFYTAPFAGNTVVLDGAGPAAGGMDSTTQTAAVRATLGTPMNGNLGLTYLQAAGPFQANGYDRVDVYGVDFNFEAGKFPISLNWNQSRTRGEGVANDIKKNNNAIDGKVGLEFGKLGLDLGYRDVQNNFGAPGYWDKIGQWTNPVNVMGPYANLKYAFTPRLSFVANGAFYKGAKTVRNTGGVAILPDVMDQTGDKVWKAEGGLKFGISKTNTADLGIQYIQWKPDGFTKTKESYINLGVAHAFTRDASVKLGYQIMDYKPGNFDVYDLGRYKGGVAVAQFNAKF